MLYDASSLRLEAPVLEHLAVKLKPGDQLSVYVDALERKSRPRSMKSCRKPMRPVARFW